MKKFKNNLMSLMNLFDSEEELCDFLISKNAFNERFVERIIETKDQEDFKEINKINTDDIDYDISYEDDKILVDITKNDVFSYLDTEIELISKMKLYIKTEQYEKAQLMKNYFNTIELDFI